MVFCFSKLNLDRVGPLGDPRTVLISQTNFSLGRNLVWNLIMMSISRSFKWCTFVSVTYASFRYSLFLVFIVCRLTGDVFEL